MAQLGNIFTGKYTDIQTLTPLHMYFAYDTKKLYGYNSDGSHYLLAGFDTETDPIFTASPSYGITDLNIANWQEAYSWGDHSTFGYITGISVSDLNTNLSVSNIAEIEGTFIYETVTKLNTPTISNNVLTLSFQNENDQAQTVSIDLSPFSGIHDISYDPLTNYITITESDGVTEWIIDLSEFVLSTSTDVNGVTSVSQEGTVKLTVSKVGQSGEFADLLNKPTTIAGYNISDAYNKTEINNFFGGTTTILGYNKTNWDTAYGWGDHSTFGYITGISVNATNTNLVQHEIATVEGTSIQETVTKLNTPSLSGNILTIKFINENGVEQTESVDLSGLTTTDTSISNATYDASTNVITLTESDGTTYTIDLSEFSILTTTDANGVTTLTQEGVNKIAISKVGQSGKWVDLLSRPTTLSGFGITDAHTKTEISNFFSGLTTITGYNKSNWDTAYGWGDHSTVGYLTSYTETDPIFVASPAYGITATDKTNWNTAYGWGDHSTVGYLTSYTETDPIFVASPAYGITTTNKTNWDTAYNWGDHSVQGYLKSYTETDPIFVASPAYGITDSQILNWNTAYGWGDHSVQGYLKSFTESDPIFVASPAYDITETNKTNWNTAYGWGDHSGLYLPITGGTVSGSITSTDGNPLIIKGGTYKSWLLHKPATDSFIFTSSSTANGTDWNWAGQIIMGDDGSVTANKFIRKSGTASQFLKGDGSVDTNTYALSSDLGNYVTLGTNQTITAQKTFDSASIFNNNIEMKSGWMITSAGTRTGIGGLPNLSDNPLQVHGGFDMNDGNMTFMTGGVANNVFYTGGAETMILRNFGSEPSTLFEIRSKAGNPTTDVREATLALTRTDDAGNAEFMDIYNNGYHTGTPASVQHGIRIQSRGTGQIRPFVFDWYDGTTYTDGMTIDITNGFKFFKNVELTNNLTVTGTISEGGTLLSNLYAPISHTHDWADITNPPSFDNYQGWNLNVNTGTATSIGSGNTVNLIGGGDLTITRSGNDITFSTTDTNTDTYHNAMSFITSGTGAGDLSLTSANGGPTITQNLDGRYSLLGHVHDAADITTGTLSYGVLPISSLQVDKWDNDYLPKAGGTMTGAIDFNDSGMGYLSFADFGGGIRIGRYAKESPYSYLEVKKDQLEIKALGVYAHGGSVETATASAFDFNAHVGYSGTYGDGESVLKVSGLIDPTGGNTTKMAMLLEPSINAAPEFTGKIKVLDIRPEIVSLGGGTLEYLNFGNKIIAGGDGYMTATGFKTVTGDGSEVLLDNGQTKPVSELSINPDYVSKWEMWDANLSVSGNILPTVDNTQTLGSPTLMWKDLYIGPGSLYVNGKKVIEDVSDTMNFTTDLDQNLSIKTSGIGNLQISSLGSDVEISAPQGLIQLNGSVLFEAGALLRTSTGVSFNFDDSIKFSTGEGIEGDLNVSNNVVANKFIKLNGTSTQFLKADGSVDSNSYSLAGHNHTLSEITDFDNNNFLHTTGNETKSGDLTLNNNLNVSGLTNAAGIYSIENGVIRVANPKGGTAYLGNLTQTGAIKIQLPVLNTNTTLSFRVHIYDHAEGEGVELFISGNNNSSNWINPTVRVISGDAGKDHTVRFGEDASKDCIWIGELSTTWTYCNVVVHDFSGGFAGQTSAWAENWKISLVTAFDTVQVTKSGNFPYADFNKLKSKTATNTQLVLGDGSGVDESKYFYKDGSRVMTGNLTVESSTEAILYLKGDKDNAVADDGSPVSTIDFGTDGSTGSATISALNSSGNTKLRFKVQNSWMTLNNQGALTTNSFIKSGSSDSEILLGGGGTKPLTEVVQTSGDQTITGNLNLASGEQNGLTTDTVLSTVSATDFDAAHFDYVIKREDAVAMRTGTVMAVWDGTNVQITDMASMDLGGSTSAIDFTASITTGQVSLTATILVGTWTVKISTRTI